MSTEIREQLVDRHERLQRLHERLRARLRLRPAGTVTVRRPGEGVLLRGLTPAELQEFARGCHAHVVRRAGGEAFDFSFAGPAEVSNT